MSTVIFETKWHAEAELICRTWASNHWEQLLVKGRGSLEFAPLIKLRLAHRDEIAYAAENADFEVQDGTRIVHLRKLGSSDD